MSNSSVPPIVFTDRGFVAPGREAILAGAQADLNAAFGGDLNPALETPQGQLATSETAIIQDAYAQFLALANGVDPAYASGRLQDAIGRIYFLERTPAEPTVVIATCVGLAGTAIPVGALAQAADGNLYTCTQAGTIPVGGSIDLTFACTVTGPVACPAGNLSSIYRAIPGWDTVTNASDGAVGNVVESRADFEARRVASVAQNARGSLPAVRGAVLGVANVLDAYVTENDTGASVVVTGVTLVAHSLYVCVAGGLAADVAQAIWSKKDPGCAYNGSTTVTVYDSQSGYSIPYPSYAVKFQIAAPLTVTFAVSITDSPQVPVDAEAQVQAAIVAAFAGLDGRARARIGATVYASRFYAPVAALGDWAEIIEITLTAGANSVAVNIDQIPVTSAGDITLTLV